MGTNYYDVSGNLLFTSIDVLLTNDSYTFTNANKHNVIKVIVGSNVISLNSINNNWKKC